ncbi:hypothetical protein [Prosthecobacter sp.]|uniref:hypothetical protein n=1 Tax=Prosthecobacter sp. TaxID=1965333 RepID=UPI001D49B723|nr:hypothetical protein [Prosthecobacter sp.]MCB1278154.1 hypothetical protein [Prosthecobacter sp.]
MSAIAEQIDLRLRQLPPQRAATLERIIVNLLDMVEGEVPMKNGGVSDDDRRAEALAALNRIASRGGMAGIDDVAAWQHEQRADRVLPGRDS